MVSTETGAVVGGSVMGANVSVGAEAEVSFSSSGLWGFSTRTRTTIMMITAAASPRRIRSTAEKEKPLEGCLRLLLVEEDWGLGFLEPEFLGPAKPLPEEPLPPELLPPWGRFLAGLCVGRPFFDLYSLANV